MTSPERRCVETGHDPAVWRRRLSFIHVLQAKDQFFHINKRTQHHHVPTKHHSSRPGSLLLARACAERTYEVIQCSLGGAARRRRRAPLARNSGVHYFLCRTVSY